jgi:hypothetical protein
VRIVKVAFVLVGFPIIGAVAGFVIVALLRPTAVSFAPLAAAMQQRSEPRPNGVIYGFALAHDGQPAKGIRLTACPLGVAIQGMLPHTRTDNAGAYRFENLPWWGRYTVYAEDEEAGYPFITDRHPPEVEVTPEHREAKLDIYLPPKRRTYVSPDGTFQFSYPTWLVLHADAEKFGGYLCHDSVVCLEYPRELYEGYDFGHAEFWVNTHPVQVRDVRRGGEPITNEADCLTFRTNTEPVSTTVINGVKFATWSRGGAAGGTSSEFQFFRTFHKGKCYELGTDVSISYDGWGKEEYESGKIKHFTAAEQKKVRGVLDAIVRTFRFLK